MTDTQLTIGMPTSTFLPALGGVEIGLHNIATRLLARGHTPVIAAPAGSVRALRQTGIKLPYKVESFPPKTLTLIQHWPDLGTRFLAGWLARFERQNRINAWHATVGFPTGVATIRHAAGRRPHLVRCAGEDIQIAPELGYGMRLNPKIDRLVRDWLPRADVLVAITDSVAEEYRKLGVTAAHIRAIPNGVDLDRFRQPVDRGAIRARHGIEEDTFLFTAVGRNHPKKGYGDLLTAMRGLIDQGQSGFVVALAGKDTEALASKAAALGLGDRVRLLGPMGQPMLGDGLKLPGEDLVDLYRAADGFVFPSHVETFGIALVEAMAAGLPIITTDGPGCRNIIEDGRWGEMVPAGNPEALCTAMQKLMTEPDLRQKRTAQAHERAEAFSWDAIVDQYVKVYRDTMAMACRQEQENS